jgi:penicillin-binding protein 2
MAFDFDNERNRAFTRRALLLAGAQGLLVVGLMGRLYYLGVLEGDQYKTLSDDNRLSLRLLAPARGYIFDRRGVPLALNRKDLQVHLVPESAKDVAGTLAALGRILQVSDADLERIKRKIARQPGFVPVTVAEGLDWESFARINVEMPELPGVVPVEDETRFYPEGPVAAHLVGYVGLADVNEVRGDPILQLPGFRIGKQGFEKSFDRDLRGQVGTSRVEVNAYGRMVREVARQPGKRGAPVTLTVDVEVQRFAAERLKDESAAAVVIDVQGGDVLAAVSTPGFNPNVFNHGIAEDEWRQLLADPKRPLVNKFLTGQYPPGSTIKPAVALAALEAGVIDENESVVCRGKIKLGDSTFHCWRPEGHGRVALVDAISRSCDVYFYEVSKRVGADRIAEMAHRLALGEAYDLHLLGQAKGLVPTPAWKLATQGTRWSLGETLITGIGQGAFLATPLQMAVMAARIANGGKAVTPRLVYAVGDQVLAAAPFGDLTLNARHLALVHRGMEGVLEPGGTAAQSRLTGSGMSMAGKTGSSQVRRITQAERDAGLKDQMQKPWEERDHAIFLAYAPVEEPRYALSVVVEHGGGGSRAAAPVARDIMRKVLELDPARQPVIMPLPDDEPTRVASGEGGDG